MFKHILFDIDLLKPEHFISYNRETVTLYAKVWVVIVAKELSSWSVADRKSVSWKLTKTFVLHILIIILSYLMTICLTFVSHVV